MHNRDHEKLRSAFTELEAKRILTRAARLDATDSTSFTADELIRIADDAGISRRAIDHALNEELTDHPNDARSDRSWPNRIRGLGLAAVGAGLGALAVTMDMISLGPQSAAAVFGPSAAFTLYLALKHRWHGNLGDYLREIGVVLGSFTLAAVVIEGTHALNPALYWSVLAAVAGSCVVAVRVQTDGSPASVQPTSSAD